MGVVMKAIRLELEDVVFFPNGKFGVVESKFIEREYTVVWFDCFKTKYLHDDELLVARRGQVL